MSGFRIVGLDPDLSAEVRRSLRSPEYGHPAVSELAKGYGPCRSCLAQFAVGQEERLLFTYRPRSEGGTVGAPGPVFIHKEDCPRYDGDRFPEGLRGLPLLFEARGAAGQVVETRIVNDNGIEPAIEQLLGRSDTEYLHLRNAEAGCHIARIDRSNGAGR